MKTGDRGTFFKFEDGQTAPIVNRDDLDDKNENELFHIRGWGLGKQTSSDKKQSD